ncbi:hypothetical protein KSP40_PGU006314 [Platanthera guangdongensis]|uniref:Uncharacterized protein n=1 Tax=Platanthera guangdongensis TaxID=2320717 RepID=A0ABR2LUY3_9ASPA
MDTRLDIPASTPRSQAPKLALLLHVLVRAAEAFAGGGSREVAGVQPLSTISIQKVALALDDSASIKASPILLGLQRLASVESRCTLPFLIRKKFRLVDVEKLSIRAVRTKNGVR